MEESIGALNDAGQVAYGIKCAAALIHHFGYGIEEWREILEFMCDYTYLICTFEKVRGRRASSEGKWTPEAAAYMPECVLRPDFVFGDGLRCPLTSCCGMRSLQFGKYGADRGLCLKLQECRRAELERSGEKAADRGRIHELYLRADFRLLRAINNVLDHTSDMSYDFFDDGRIVFLRDTLSILDGLGIPHPDFEGLHEYAFGRENGNKRFSSYELIR